MVMITKTCDRCGEKIDPLISDNQHIDYSIIEVTCDGRTTLDLCPACKNSFYKWLENSTKERNKK